MKLIDALTVLPPNFGNLPRSFNAIKDLEFFLAHGKRSEALLAKVGPIEVDKNAENMFYQDLLFSFSSLLF